MIGNVVMPKNFDNPDEAFALAKLWAKRRERKLLEADKVVIDQLTDEQHPEKNDD